MLAEDFATFLREVRRCGLHADLRIKWKLRVVDDSPDMHTLSNERTLCLFQLLRTNLNKTATDTAALAGTSDAGTNPVCICGLSLPSWQTLAQRFVDHSAGTSSRDVFACLLVRAFEKDGNGFAPLVNASVAYLDYVVEKNCEIDDVPSWEVELKANVFLRLGCYRLIGTHGEKGAAWDQ